MFRVVSTALKKRCAARCRVLVAIVLVVVVLVLFVVVLVLFVVFGTSC